MPNINDGGPAFPFSLDKSARPTEDFLGMSLRDYFAAKAMHAFLTTALVDISGEAIGSPLKCADWAYDQADAMLAARKPAPNLERVMCDDRR